MSHVLRLLRQVAQLLTPTGRGLATVGVICLQLGVLLSLVEVWAFGAVSLALLLLAVPWLLVPAGVQARILLHPPRAVAGEEVTARVTVSHEWGLPLWQPLLRALADGRETWLRMPTLRSGSTLTSSFQVETQHRGVMAVGPVEHHLTDPLGLLRRPRTWVAPVELYVRPRMVALDTLGGGQVTDLEGVSSDQISMSDLAFHALREYVRGDDLRHVHWRSSARAGQLLVRQYQDSRRNHATVVFDLAAASYGKGAARANRGEPDEGFELAACIAASLVSCAALESQVVSMVAGAERLPARNAGEVLDALCRVQPMSARKATTTLADDVAAAIALVPDTSLLLVVTGPEAEPADITSSLWVLPSDTNAVVLRAAPGAEAGIALAAGRKVLTVGDLTHLPGLMKALQ